MFHWRSAGVHYWPRVAGVLSKLPLEVLNKYVDPDVPVHDAGLGMGAFGWISAQLAVCDIVDDYRTRMKYDVVVGVRYGP